MFQAQSMATPNRRKTAYSSLEKGGRSVFCAREEVSSSASLLEEDVGLWKDGETSSASGSRRLYSCVAEVLIGLSKAARNLSTIAMVEGRAALKASYE